MKILLIGHSIIDNIKRGGEYKTFPGGIFYSLLGTMSVSRSEDEIYLLTGYNSKSFHLFDKLYSKVSLRYSQIIDDLPEVILDLRDNEERKETYKNLSTGLSLDQINDWNQFDGILINMVTGFDISLGQLKVIRNKYSGPIYFDFHTLSRGINSNLERNFRPLPSADEWLRNIDLLQCNEMELRTISILTNELEAAKHIIDKGLKLLIITKGEKGADLYYSQNSIIKLLHNPAISAKAINKIGCGDIFGAVFFYNYLCCHSLEISLDQAIKFAGRSVSLNITENLNTFLND